MWSSINNKEIRVYILYLKMLSQRGLVSKKFFFNCSSLIFPKLGLEVVVDDYLYIGVQCAN